MTTTAEKFNTQKKKREQLEKYLKKLFPNHIIEIQRILANKFELRIEVIEK